jgi:predicted MFS family arabinose efflux permease
VDIGDDRGAITHTGRTQVERPLVGTDPERTEDAELHARASLRSPEGGVASAGVPVGRARLPQLAHLGRSKPAPAADGAAVPGPMHYPAFRRALAGRTVSTAGSWMQTVAAGWLIYDLTRSASAVAVLTVFSRGPGMLLSTYGGELADRYDRRRLCIAGFVVQAVVAAVLAALVWDGISRVTEVYAATFVIGVAGALVNPSVQLLVNTTVPRELAKRAAGLGSVSYNTARLVGPAVGGGLVAGVGPGPCFAINAMSYLAVILMVAGLPHGTGATARARTRLRTAMSRARIDPLIRDLILSAVLFSVLVAPVQELAPAIARRHGEGAHLLGFLLSALAVGGLVGNLVRSALDKRGLPSTKALGASMLVCALALLVVAATTEYVVVLVAMVGCGMAWDVLYVISLTGVQFADAKLAGIMTGLFFTATLAGVTVGALLVGGLFDALGVGGGLVACAAAVAVCGIWAWTRRPDAQPLAAGGASAASDRP